MWLRKLRDQRGQALVEMALVLPVFCILLIGMINFGFIFSGKLIVNQAAREGARFIAVNNTDQAGLVAKVNIYKSFLDNLTVAYSYQSGTRKIDEYVQVNVTSAVPLITPLLRPILDPDHDGKFPVYATVQMRVE